MSTQRFSGKAVVVTGAAQGIGRGVAVAAAEEGAHVLLVDRAELVHEVQAEIAACLLYTSPSPRDRQKSRMPSSA